MNTPTENQQKFIEESGMYFEGIGLTRMAGRIIGWLLISVPVEQTMPQIVKALQASKSSISTALFMLTQFYLVERISKPGERKDYFRVADDMWYRSFKARMSQNTEVRQLAEHGLDLIGDVLPEYRKRLELMRDMYSFMEREFPKLLEKWEEEKRAKGY